MEAGKERKAKSNPNRPEGAIYATSPPRLSQPAGQQNKMAIAEALRNASARMLCQFVKVLATIEGKMPSASLASFLLCRPQDRNWDNYKGKLVLLF